MNELEKAARHFQTVDQAYQSTHRALIALKMELTQLTDKHTEQWHIRNSAQDALSAAALVVPT